MQCISTDKRTNELHISACPHRYLFYEIPVEVVNKQQKLLRVIIVEQGNFKLLEVRLS